MDTEEPKVIAYIDKTIVKITNLKIKGLKPYEIEEELQSFLDRKVRVVGVSGDSIELDVFNLDPDSIWKDEKGIIKAIATCEGLSGEEIAKISKAEKAETVTLGELRDGNGILCPKERRIRCDERPY